VQQLDPLPDDRDVHRCHARRCRIPVPPEYLFCEPHWRKVPKPLRDRVWETYRDGQCDDRNPSAEWVFAADAAIAYIDKLERGHTTLREYLLDAGANCYECPLAVEGGPGKAVASVIPVKGATVAFVGEAPGRREIVTGEPFVGPSGELLNQALAQAQVRRDDLAILNCTSCGPIPSHLDEVKKLAAKACRPRLLYELRSIQPKVILAVGGTALDVLAAEGTPGVTASRGSLVEPAPDLTWNGTVPALLPTFHPAAILRGGDGEQKGGSESKSVDVLYYFLLYDVSKAVRYARGEITPWITKGDAFARDTDGRLRQVLFGPPPVLGLPVKQEKINAALAAFIQKAEKAGEFALDVETTGKDSLECGLTSIAIATAEDGFVATWDIWERSPVMLELLRELLANRALRKILQNGIFDCTVLYRYGLPILDPVDDTLLQHHASFPGLAHQLQQVVSQFFLAPPWKAEFRKSTKEVADLTTYNLGDAQGTARLAPPLRKAIAAVGTEKVYEADRQMMRVAERMRRVGFWIDRVEQRRQAAVQHARIAYMKEHLRDELAKLSGPWKDALARVNAAWRRKKDPESYEERVVIRLQEIEKDRGKQSLTDERMIGLFKPKGKRDLVALFDVLQIPASGFTGKLGLPKTGKDDMERAAALHPLMRKLLHLREASNIDALFISGLPIKEDGRVHPDWKVHGTIAGRWSAGKAQNWKKDMPGWPPEVGADGQWKLTPSGDWVCPKENPRAQVCAPPGRILVGADFDALHWNIFALLTGDEFLNDCIARGRDMHPIVARECFPDFVSIDDELARLGVMKPKEGLPDHLRGDKELVRRWKLWKMIRDIAKKIGYGRAYGGGAETIFEQAVKDFPSLTFADVDRALPIIDRMIAGVTEWRAQQEEAARRDRQSREPLLGRVRLYPLGNFDPNVVYNFPILAFESALQNRAIFRFVSVLHPELLDLETLVAVGVLWKSDVIWIKSQRAQLAFAGIDPPQTELLINGHDSMLAESPLADGERIAKMMQGAMTQRISFGGRSILFRGEAATGDRWSKV